MHEFGLLVVVATPVVLILVLQVFLFIGGERGTLLFPSLARYPAVEPDTPAQALEQNEQPEASVGQPPERQIREAA